MHHTLPITATAAASVYSQDNIDTSSGFSIEGISNFPILNFQLIPPDGI